MSATRYNSQKIAFVYSNLYQIYRQGKETAAQSPVLKAQDLRADSVQAEAPVAAVKISPYSPMELIGKRVQKPEALKVAEGIQSASSPSPIEGLKNNLKTLNDLHSRLRFMLKELEDLVKE